MGRLMKLRLNEWKYPLTIFFVTWIFLWEWMYLIRRIYPADITPNSILRPYIGVAPETNPFFEVWQRWAAWEYWKRTCEWKGLVCSCTDLVRSIHVSTLLMPGTWKINLDSIARSKHPLPRIVYFSRNQYSCCYPPDFLKPFSCHEFFRYGFYASLYGAWRSSLETTPASIWNLLSWFYGNLSNKNC
jgi:hypothetical protein